MERLDPWVVGWALAVTAAALYSVCVMAFAIAPAATLGFFDTWFHGLNLAALQAGAKPLTLGVFLYGLIGLAVSAFVSGAAFAVIYNLFRLCPGYRHWR